MSPNEQARYTAEQVEEVANKLRYSGTDEFSEEGADMLDAYAQSLTAPAGGVSDAMVERAMDAFYRAGKDGAETGQDKMRAALEAALSAPEPAAQGEGYIVVKEHVWQHDDGGRPTLAYLWPSEFERQVFPTFEQACAFIHEEPGLPLGWVALKINLAAPPAQPAERVPEGFVLVPREPTDAMWDAAVKASCEAESVYEEPRPRGAWEKFGLRRNRIRHVRDAMLAAAPASPAPAAQGQPGGNGGYMPCQCLTMKQREYCVNRFKCSTVTTQGDTP